jgi:hypothetical protein
MPRWPADYKPRQRQICPRCGGKKDYYAVACRSCANWAKPLLGVTGPDHPAWKTGQRIDEDGYLKTYASGHPWPRRGGYIFEHVRIMELALGRRLRSGETVHHEDLDRLNNTFDNLTLIGRGAHSRLHRNLDAHLQVRDQNGRFAPRREVQNASK